MNDQSSVALAEVLQQVQDLKRELAPLIKQDTSESRRWQILVIALPVVLTSALAGIGYLAQSALQHSVEDSTTKVTAEINRRDAELKAEMARREDLFKSRIALAEELYRRRLSAYEQAYVHMLNLQLGISDYRNTQDIRKMNTSMAELNRYYQEKRIYLSPNLYLHLGDLWTAASRIGPQEPQDWSKWLQPHVDSIQSDINTDLHIAELSRVPDENMR